MCRVLGITEQTSYRWWREYGGLKIEQGKRLNILAQESTRLRRAVDEGTTEFDLGAYRPAGYFPMPVRMSLGK
jgi:hypothetical protein